VSARPDPDPNPTSPERSDHDLLRDMAAEDPTAFPALVERWRSRVVNFLLSRGADHGSAEDCAQETLLRVYGYRHSYRPEAPFTAFLFTVARNALLDWKRSRARHRDREGSDDALAGQAAPAAGVDSVERLDLAAAVLRLPRRLAEVVELGAVRGLPYQVVGTLLGIPEGTVKSRMFHAVRELRRLLGEERDDA